MKILKHVIMQVKKNIYSYFYLDMNKLKSYQKRIKEGENIFSINQTITIKNEEIKNILPPIIPSYYIDRMETDIKIQKDKTYGQIIENVKFVLKNGRFYSIIRKISLAGSSDSIIAFKVSSK